MVPALSDNNDMIKWPIYNGNGHQRGMRGRVLHCIDISQRGKRSNRGPQEGPVKLDPETISTQIQSSNTPGEQDSSVDL